MTVGRRRRSRTRLLGAARFVLCARSGAHERRWFGNAAAQPTPVILARPKPTTPDILQPPHPISSSCGRRTLFVILRPPQAERRI